MQKYIFISAIIILAIIIYYFTNDQFDQSNQLNNLDKLDKLNKSDQSVQNNKTENMVGYVDQQYSTYQSNQIDVVPFTTTPFVWNNGTRIPKLYGPYGLYTTYYQYLHDWYVDSYLYPFCYFC